MLPDKSLWLRSGLYTGKIGQFIFFLGFLALIIFMATDQAGMPKYPLFCSGVVLVFWGIYVMWKHRQPPEPSDRFSALRKMRQRKRENIEAEKFTATEERSKKPQ